MKKYHKIKSIFKREEKGGCEFIESEFSCPEFEYLQNNTWIFTEKVDGTNIRVDWDNINKTVELGGRTDNAQIPTTLIQKLQELFHVGKFMSLYPETPMTLYGEGYGVKIQKGGGNYNPDGVGFVLFDVMIDGWYLRRVDTEDISDKLLVRVVPILGEGTLWDAVDIIKAGTTNSSWGNFLLEGFVIRPKVDIFARNGDRIITKIKHRDYGVK